MLPNNKDPEAHVFPMAQQHDCGHNVFIPEWPPPAPRPPPSALRLGAKQPNRLLSPQTNSPVQACVSFRQQCTKEGHLQIIVVFIIYMPHSNKLFVTDAKQIVCLFFIVGVS